MRGKFFPSEIENEIYDIMDDYETEGMDLFNYGLTEALADFFEKEYPDVEYQIGCSEWPNAEGGVCALSWMESNHPHLVMFDYKYAVYVHDDEF